MVIAIIAILALMLLPALSKSKAKAQGVHCLNNGRQQSLGWRQWSDDNNDVLLAAQDGLPAARPNWLMGQLDFTSNPCNWNLNTDLSRSPMWNYVGKSSGIFKCPSERYHAAECARRRFLGGHPLDGRKYDRAALIREA